jgi:hypothetical protein
VSHCVQLFGDRMVPYMAKDAPIALTPVASRGVSRRTTVGKGMRHKLEEWGFM